VVARTTEDFNAVMPATGPILRYVRGDATVCAEEVTVCSRPMSEQLGLTFLIPDQERIELTDSPDPWLSPDDRAWLACHEMMHALTHVGDNPTLVIEDSCVWGTRTTPGSWDTAVLNQTFGGTP
jgi:hypothetical protein